MKNIYHKRIKKINISIDRNSETIIGFEIKKLCNISAIIFCINKYQLTIAYIGGLSDGI